MGLLAEQNDQWLVGRRSLCAEEPALVLDATGKAEREVVEQLTAA